MLFQKYINASIIGSSFGGMDKKQNVQEQNIQNITPKNKTTMISKCPMLQNVLCYKMSNVTKCPMLQNVQCYKMSYVTKCPMLQNVQCYKMSNVTKCPMLQNVQ